jgi:hypothetical protein
MRRAYIPKEGSLTGTAVKIEGLGKMVI